VVDDVGESKVWVAEADVADADAVALSVAGGLVGGGGGEVSRL